MVRIMRQCFNFNTCQLILLIIGNGVTLSARKFDPSKRSTSILFTERFSNQNKKMLKAMKLSQQRLMRCESIYYLIASTSKLIFPLCYWNGIERASRDLPWMCWNESWKSLLAIVSCKKSADPVYFFCVLCQSCDIHTSGKKPLIRGSEDASGEGGKNASLNWSMAEHLVECLSKLIMMMRWFCWNTINLSSFFFLSFFLVSYFSLIEYLRSVRLLLCFSLFHTFPLILFRSLVRSIFLS